MKASSPTPDHESKITAYLLGELSAEEQKAFEAALDQDEKLRGLTERLRLTIGLVKEAAPLSETVEAGTSSLPNFQFDPDRRKALMATLSSPRAVKSEKPIQSHIPWYWPIGVAAALMLSLSYFAYFPARPQALRARMGGADAILLTQESARLEEFRFDADSTSGPSAAPVDSKLSLLAAPKPKSAAGSQVTSSTPFAVTLKSNTEAKSERASVGREVALRTAVAADRDGNAHWGLMPEQIVRAESPPVPVVAFTDEMSISESPEISVTTAPRSAEKLVAQSIQKESLGGQAYFAQSLSEGLVAEAQELKRSPQESTSRFYRYQTKGDSVAPKGEMMLRRQVAAETAPSLNFGDVTRDFSEHGLNKNQDGLGVNIAGSSNGAELDLIQEGGFGGGMGVGGGGGLGGRGGQAMLRNSGSLETDAQARWESNVSPSSGVVADVDASAVDKFGRTDNEALYAGARFGLPAIAAQPTDDLADITELEDRERLSENLGQSKPDSLASAIVVPDIETEEPRLAGVAGELDEVRQLEDAFARPNLEGAAARPERQLSRLSLGFTPTPETSEPTSRPFSSPRNLLERAPQSSLQPSSSSRGVASFGAQPNLDVDFSISPDLDRNVLDGYTELATDLGRSRGRASNQQGVEWFEPELGKATNDLAIRLAKKPALPLLALKTKSLSDTTKELRELKQPEEQRFRAKKASPSPQRSQPKAQIAKPAFPQEKQTADEPVSTFSLNVSDVSFKLAHASLQQGALPAPEAVRPEEFINALNYHDIPSEGRLPVAVLTERARLDFGHQQEVLRISLKTRSSGRSAQQPMNLVVLLDNSGSMERPDRQIIVQRSLESLMSALAAHDRVSLITFARQPRLWAEALSPTEALARVNELTQVFPEGGTNLEAALETAYSIAAKNYQHKGKNRVILLTDGAANLGNTRGEALRTLVEFNRQSGIALDSFGIGFDGFEDERLEALTRNGDGRYAFLNSAEDVETNFLRQLTGALNVAAKNVKVQITFNPERVDRYRQIGYAKHQLKKEQFRDNRVDAAELAAEESGSALYLIATNPNGSGPVGELAIRFQSPETGRYEELSWPLPYSGPAADLEQVSAGTQLATAAAFFAERLADIPYSKSVPLGDLEAIVTRHTEAAAWDPAINELKGMIQQARRIAPSNF